MNKIKKIFASFGLFITGLISKVYAIRGDIETKYGVFEPEIVEDKYGVYDPGMYQPKYGIVEPRTPEPSVGERILSTGKFVLPIILFFIGLFVVLNKKITRKTKTIVVTALIIIAVLGYIIIDYIANNL